jgi:flagellar hook-associated protein 1 FlgK
MSRTANLNQQLAASQKNDGAAAAMQDQRDQYITQLSQLMDIRVVDGGNNQLNVFTTAGVQLVGAGAAQFSFDAQSTIGATTLYNADANKRGVGTITLTGTNGQGIDLLANNSIRSGSIAALVEMRDNVLVQAQTQLDSIASAMSRALSDKTVTGAAAPLGPQAGFDLDLSGLAAGNTVRLTYADTLTNTTHNVTFVRVDDPSALPLSNTGASPNDRTVGLNFGAGFSSIASQIASALGSGFSVSSPSGSILRVLDDGASGHIDIGSLTATKTVTGLTGGGAELPFFMDGIGAFTGTITGAGMQATGLAARISVNAALLADPSRLVVYQTSPLTQAGDTTRPDFLYRQLTSASLYFSPDSGIGTAASPFQGPLPGFMRQMLSQQGEASAAAANLKQGQDVVLNALQQRMDDASGVNIDQEMTTLLNLQNAYAANARVLSAVKDMFDLLSKI